MFINTTTTTAAATTTTTTMKLTNQFKAEMEPGLRVTDFGPVRSCHQSVYQSRCLTCFWVSRRIYPGTVSTVTPSLQT